MFLERRAVGISCLVTAAFRCIRESTRGAERKSLRVKVKEGSGNRFTCNCGVSGYATLGAPSAARFTVASICGTSFAAGQRGII